MQINEPALKLMGFYEIEKNTYLLKSHGYLFHIILDKNNENVFTFISPTGDVHSVTDFEELFGFVAKDLFVSGEEIKIEELKTFLKIIYEFIMCREYTKNEIREKFLKNVWGILNYWKNESHAKTLDEKMEGFAFSLLVLLDGGHGDSPGFIVAPHTDESYRKYLISQGENYYPQNHKSNVNGDIAGCLHDLFKKYDTTDKTIE